MSLSSALEQGVRLAARAEDEKLSDFARRANIPYGTMRGYASGKSQPGVEHLERLQEAGLDVSGVMSGTISFMAGDDRMSKDWPMLEGAHAGNALLGLMFVRAFQGLLFRRIADASDAFVAEHHGAVGKDGKALSFRQNVAVSMAHWDYATDRLREIATSSNVDVGKIAALSADEVVYIILLGMPESDIHTAVKHVGVRAATGQ